MYRSPKYEMKNLHSADVITASQLPLGVTAMGANNPTLKATSKTEGVDKILNVSSGVSFFKKFI